MSGQRKLVYLLGAPSVLGYNITKLAPGDLELLPICSPAAKLPEGTPWLRLNLDDKQGLEALIRERPPELVLHCGAVCNVKKSELDPDFARRVNVESVAHLLDVLPKTTRLVYCSSDHVFGAGGQTPCTESSTPAPISNYGRMRLEAEAMILDRRGSLILRCSLTVGESINGSEGHLDWLRRRTRRGLPMSIVEDEYRSVSWAPDQAQRVLDYAESPTRGLRHLNAARCESRLTLANYLDQRYAIGASFRVESRHEQKAPHLGRVELATEFDDPLAEPLPAVVDGGFR